MQPHVELCSDWESRVRNKAAANHCIVLSSVSRRCGGVITIAEEADDTSNFVMTVTWLICGLDQHIRCDLIGVVCARIVQTTSRPAFPKKKFGDAFDTLNWYCEFSNATARVSFGVMESCKRNPACLR